MHQYNILKHAGSAYCASYNYYIAIDYHSGQPTFKKDSMKVRSKSLQAEIRMIWDFHVSSRNFENLRKLFVIST